MTGNTNLILSHSIAAGDIDALHYNSTGYIANGKHTIMTNRVFLGDNVVSANQLGNRSLAIYQGQKDGLPAAGLLAPGKMGSPSGLGETAVVMTVANAYSLDQKNIENAIVNAQRENQFIVVNHKSGSLAGAQYDGAKWVDIGINKFKATDYAIKSYGMMYKAGYQNPFVYLVPNSTALSNVKALMRNNNTLAEGEAAGKRIIRDTMKAVRELLTPVISTMQSVNVVNSITLSDIEGRTARLRTLAAENDAVQGADDNGRNNIWVAVKHNKITADNGGGYADLLSVSITARLATTRRRLAMAMWEPIFLRRVAVPKRLTTALISITRRGLAFMTRRCSARAGILTMSVASMTSRRAFMVRSRRRRITAWPKEPA